MVSTKKITVVALIALSALANAGYFEVVGATVLYDGGTTWPSQSVQIGATAHATAAYWSGSATFPMSYNDSAYHLTSATFLTPGSGNYGNPLQFLLEREDITIKYTVKYVVEINGERPPKSVTGVFGRRTRTESTGMITGNWSQIMATATSYYFNPYPPTVSQPESTLTATANEAGQGILWEYYNPTTGWLVYDDVTSASASGYTLSGITYYDVYVPGPLGAYEMDLFTSMEGECSGAPGSNAIHATATAIGTWQFRLKSVGGQTLAPGF